MKNTIYIPHRSTNIPIPTFLPITFFDLKLKKMYKVTSWQNKFLTSCECKFLDKRFHRGKILKVFGYNTIASSRKKLLNFIFENRFG